MFTCCHGAMIFALLFSTYTTKQEPRILLSIKLKVFATHVLTLTGS